MPGCAHEWLIKGNRTHGCGFLHTNPLGFRAKLIFKNTMRIVYDLQLSLDSVPSEPAASAGARRLSAEHDVWTFRGFSRPEASKFSAVFALQCTQIALWESVGVPPDVVLGVDSGEIAAAYAAGVLKLEEGLTPAARRTELRNGTPSDENTQNFLSGISFAPPSICMVSGVDWSASKLRYASGCSLLGPAGTFTGCI